MFEIFLREISLVLCEVLGVQNFCEDLCEHRKFGVIILRDLGDNTC